MSLLERFTLFIPVTIISGTESDGKSKVFVNEAKEKGGILQLGHLFQLQQFNMDFTLDSFLFMPFMKNLPNKTHQKRKTGILAVTYSNWKSLDVFLSIILHF